MCIKHFHTIMLRLLCKGEKTCLKIGSVALFVAVKHDCVLQRKLSYTSYRFTALNAICKKQSTSTTCRSTNKSPLCRHRLAVWQPPFKRQYAGSNPAADTSPEWDAGPWVSSSFLCHVGRLPRPTTWGCQCKTGVQLLRAPPLPCRWFIRLNPHRRRAVKKSRLGGLSP